jgi:hypothetical protein
MRDISLDKMKEMLPKELIVRILQEKEKLDNKEKMTSVIDHMNRMNCNKRVRDKEISKGYSPSVRILYRRMFFNHYEMFHKS